MFGIKGGVVGGGYSQVIFMDEFNMYLIGDIYVIIVVNNFFVVVIDICMFYESIQKDFVFYR